MQPGIGAFVGIYDSGLGGLGVWRALSRVLPQERVLYVGDTARLPYGGRQAEEIVQFSREIIGFLHSKGAKLVIAACNTSSALALPVLAGIVPLPLVGMIETSAGEAWRATRTGRIGLLATAATIRSRAYELLFARLHPGVTVVAQACPRLVPLIEAGQLAGPEMRGALQEYVTPLLEAGVDCIILGCTHYPLVSAQIKRLAGTEVTVIDPAQAIAEKAKMLLQQRHARNTLKSGEDEIYVTGDAALFAAGAGKLGFALPAPVRRVVLAGMDARLPGPAAAISVLAWSESQRG